LHRPFDPGSKIARKVPLRQGMNGVCHGSGKNASFIKLTKAATTNLTYLDETNTITTIRHTIPIPAKA